VDLGRLRQHSSRPAGLLARGDAVGLALLLILATQFGRLQNYSLVVALVMVYAITAASLVLLFGVAGQLSLGHAIFLGIGAFVSANVSDRTGLGLEVEVPLAFASTFTVGIIVGLPAIRVRDLYLALTTFALAFAGQKALFEFRWFSGGGAGRRSGSLEILGHELDGPLAIVWVCFAILLVSFWLLRNLIRSRTGRAMHAVRTSETAASAAGINVAAFKILAFGFSAGFAGVAGVLYIHTIRFVNPENFGVEFSILLILTLIIGGKHRLAGALAGAIFVQGLPEAFRGIQEWEGMIYGTILLLLTLWSPSGLIGIVELGIAPIRRAWFVDATEPAAGDASALSSARALDAPEPHRTITSKIDAVGPSARAAVDPPAEARPAPAPVRGRLELCGVSVHFGGVAAVDDVTMAVGAGAILGLIGSNGAGKTTLFNAVTGVVRSTGTIRLDDTDLTGMSVQRRAGAGLGRTFQNLNLHAGLTTMDHVLIGLHRQARYGVAAELIRLPHVTRVERELWEEASALLERLDMLDIADRRVDALPYGMQKRVDIARALATGPDILLLDEPAAGVPSAEANETIGRVLEIAKQRQISILIIEHNVELVAAVCDEIVVMEAGRVLVSGRPHDVMRDQSVIDAYLGT
jgi:branched-chain amino acid transport system ATP-binding protein/branched-chain amino acid transport system permease protein